MDEEEKKKRNMDEEETYSAREMELRSRSEGVIQEKVLNQGVLARKGEDGNPQSKDVKS